MAPDEVTSERIQEIVHPATLAQIGHYQQMGLREQIHSSPGYLTSNEFEASLPQQPHIIIAIVP